MAPPSLGPYRLIAYNTSRESENKIHDDAVAQRFGFGGGLVPGVDVYAYMTHPAVERWGEAWLERGGASCRLLKPVYDGDSATVTATVGVEGLDLTLESRGEICAIGTAALPARTAAPPIGFAEPPAPPKIRPPADELTLAAGTRFAINPLCITAEYHAQSLADMRETAPIYREKRIVHPGTILRAGNWALAHNVVLGPWMHTGSRVQHFALAHIGDEISARSVITANYERKGHRFVDVDVLVLKNATTPIAFIAHTAIWRPRQIAAA